jgi:DNA-binding CsgD family transcriptional regulator/PAS domain-containing protein
VTVLFADLAGYTKRADEAARCDVLISLRLFQPPSCTDIAGTKEARELAAGDAEQVSSLIGDIYDAALDPAGWPDVLKQVADFVRGPAAILYTTDVARKTGSTHYSWGVEPCFLESYFQTYLKLSELSGFAALQLLAEIEEVAAGTDYIPWDEIRKTRFFREWVQPQGWGDIATAVLDKSAASFAAFTVPRHEREGVVDDAMRWRMGLLVPHLRRAVLIGKIIDLHKVEAATFAETLDGIAAGMFLVDAIGHIVHANLAGRAMLERGDILCAPSGRLIANDPHNDQALRDIFAAASGDDTAVGGRTVALPLTSRASERYVAHVLPLASGARREAGLSLGAVAAVFARKVALEKPVPLQALARHYGLTSSELRVLLAIVEVGGVPEVAPVLGISQTTVKWHLQNLFEKTNTRRQADLVKLVAGFANPIVG